MIPPGDRFSQDGDGQWWYEFSGRRKRCRVERCANCKEEFVAASSRSVYCSRGCLNKARAARQMSEKAPIVEWKGSHYGCDGDGVWWYYPPSDRPRVRCIAKTCQECGSSYVTEPFHASRSKYCSRGCAARSTGRAKRGVRGARWKGGRILRRGYVLIYRPDHHSIPEGSSRKYVLEHRLVMEEHLGRPLSRRETIHHKNGNRADNRIENLELRVGPHGVGATEKHCATCTCFDH